MNKLQRKIMIFLLVLVLLCPAGLILPKIFNSSDVWGEWDKKSVKELTGSIPQGMAKDADLWKAPVSDYRIEESPSLLRESIQYILSAAIGLGLTVLLTYGIIKLMSKDERTP